MIDYCVWVYIQSSITNGEKMPVISQREIPMSIRKPHLDKRKAELKQALLSATSEDQYLRIKKELDNLGKAKEYGEHIPFPIGAIQVPQQ